MSLVVTAADERYAPLLLDCLRSVKAAVAAAGLPDVKLGCVDLGLSDATLATVATLADEVYRPTEWPFRPHAIFGMQPRYLSRAIRPFLPRYFPGHDVYLWLDSDTWVQDGTALKHLVHVAKSVGAAFVPGVDRSYMHSDQSREWVEARYRMGLPASEVERLRVFGYVNSGVFALAAAAPHWKLWEQRFQAALDRWQGDFLSDQAIVNAVIYLDHPPTIMMPAEYNWICHLRLPLWSTKLRRFVNPNFPWTGIGVVHNTLNDKAQRLAVPATEGLKLEMPLTYSAYLALLEHKRA